MATDRYYWLRLKKDFFTDKRIKKLRKVAGGDTYTIIYLKMQLLSLQDKGNLYFENIEDTFEEEIALQIDEDVEDVKITINFLINTGLLVQINDFSYELIETKNCIGSETAVAERVRKSREKKRLEIEKNNSNLLQCNIDVTKCNIEKEKEKEIEINKKENIKRKNFIKPTVEEIQAYCKERNNGINANAFYDFYESKDWYVGKNKMKDWKACVRTWEQRNKQNKVEEQLPEWFNKELKNEQMSEQDKQEMDSLLNEIINM